MYAIRLNWIDDDGYYRSKVMKSYENRDDALKDYPAYIRLDGYGWYDVIEVSSEDEGGRCLTL